MHNLEFHGCPVARGPVFSFDFTTRLEAIFIILIDVRMQTFDVKRRKSSLFTFLFDRKGKVIRLT